MPNITPGPNYPNTFESWWETCQVPNYTGATGVLANAFKEVAFRGWTAHKDAIRPVVYALLDILDGVPTHDIQNMTGLPTRPDSKDCRLHGFVSQFLKSDLTS